MRNSNGIWFPRPFEEDGLSGPFSWTESFLFTDAVINCPSGPSEHYCLEIKGQDLVPAVLQISFKFDSLLY